ncbi:hypothetical protein [Nocardioides marmoraquaticus]
MADRYDPGTEPDRPDYRHRRPATPCQMLIRIDGVPKWCPGSLSIWAYRSWYDPQRYGPDGWSAWGEWYLDTRRKWSGWAH